MIMMRWDCLLAAAFATALFWNAIAQEPAGNVMHVGSKRQLLIDNLFFESVENVTLEVHPAVKTGEKNVESDRPWESATLNWFTVMEDPRGTLGDGARYRMWYECYDLEGWPTSDDTSFCYAESRDGIQWTKPNLGLFEYQGSTDTNILFRMIGPEGAHSRVHGACVFKDPGAPQPERYKGVSQGMFSALGTPPHRIAGMFSPDGLRWERYADPICDVFADSQYSAFWDNARQRYVVYGRTAGRGRAIGRSESGDFTHFDALALVLTTDDNDPDDSDLYNPAALKYPYAANAYFMFVSLFQHEAQTLEIRLAVSRDGVNWSWPERDKAFIPLGEPGAFDSGSLYMGQGLLRAGDKLWQYYGGSPLLHDEDASENPKSRFYSRVITRIDGYVSAEAGLQGGRFVTPPLSFTGNLLKLNVKVREGGNVRVGLLDEQGQAVQDRALDDCVPLTGDGVDVLVRWKTGGDVTSRAMKPTRLEVEMKEAGLYAFQFTMGFAGEGRDH